MNRLWSSFEYTSGSESVCQCGMKLFLINKTGNDTLLSQILDAASGTKIG